jgi:hypothetical protein
MMDPTGTSVTSENSARARLLELKRRLDDLKLEALRRGYGLDPGAPSTGIEDLDTIVSEVTADVEQLREARDTVQGPLRDGDRPAASRA